jgi:hypothetical protein
MTFPNDDPTKDEIRWLFAQGVPDTAMLEPTPIRAANVVFRDGNTFDFDAGGVRAFIFREDECDDLIAWRPDQLGSWCARSFALGQEAIWNPASWFMGEGLFIRRSPLQWLRADRNGIVIVRPDLAYAMLRHVPRLAFADAAHARQVRTWLQPPKVRCEFLVETARERRAA